MNNFSFTENGALAYQSTGNLFLDMFSTIASARGESIPYQVNLFSQCYSLNKNLALKILLWTRDIRGGAGAREVFRKIITDLSNKDPETVIKLINAGVFEEYGRWDDLFSVFNSEQNNVVKAALIYIQKALLNRDSLCAKWAPRQGPIANKIRKFLRLSPKEYRKLLVELTNVVESKMCKNDWNNIDFNKLTSRNLSDYSNTFRKHSGIAWDQYKNDIIEGKAKVKASTLYPHDLVRTVLYGDNELSTLQWQALPDFLKTSKNILPIIDVSGSMDFELSGSVNAKMVAIGLGLYVSERNQGYFQNKAVTFAEVPELIDTVNMTFTEKVLFVNESNWGYNTNLEAVFKMILHTAIQDKLSEEEIPEVVLIISDMQFDRAIIDGEDISLFKSMKQKYKNCNYEMPKVVFWNVASRVPNTFPAINTDTNTVQISGFSPNILNTVFSILDEDFSPEKIMYETVNVPRYAVIDRL
jgi:hypothetical protein